MAMHCYGFHHDRHSPSYCRPRDLEHRPSPARVTYHLPPGLLRLSILARHSSVQIPQHEQQRRDSHRHPLRRQTGAWRLPRFVGEGRGGSSGTPIAPETPSGGRHEGPKIYRRSILSSSIITSCLILLTSSTCINLFSLLDHQTISTSSTMFTSYLMSYLICNS